MTRIFSSLALLAFSLLVANLLLGLSAGDYNGAARRLVEAQREVAAASKSLHASASETKAAKERLRVLAEEVRPTVQRAQTHMWLGVAAALVNVLVNSITITYFIGTSRWVREVAETYHLNPEYVRRSSALKRSTFPWALGAILIILGLVALGAASDPSASVEDSSQWVTPHYVTALVGVGLIGWSFLVQARSLAANYDAINEIIADVQRIRQEYGLAVE